MAYEFDPCFPLNGETDAGKLAIGAVWDVAAAAFAAYNSYVAIQMAKKQDAIARRYLNIAQAHRDWYNTGFKPLEDQELAEAWALPETTPNWDTAIGRAKATGKFLFRNRLELRMRGTRPCDTGLRVGVLKDEINIQSAAVAVMAGLGLRNERARVDAMNDRRWKRREQVLNRGRDMMADNVVYGTLAAGIYGDMGRQAGKGAEGALYFLGYSSERRQTQYPGDMIFGRRQARQPSQATPQFSGTMTGGGPASSAPVEGNYFQSSMTGSRSSRPIVVSADASSASFTGGQGLGAYSIALDRAGGAYRTASNLSSEVSATFAGGRSAPPINIVSDWMDDDYFIADPFVGG